jgi:hypothetical protein
MKVTESHLRKIIRKSLLREQQEMLDIVVNEYEDVEDINILANYALRNDMQGALKEPELQHYIEKNEAMYLTDEGMGWLKHVGEKEYGMVAPEGWDLDKIVKFFKDFEDEAYKEYDKMAQKAINSDPDKEFLEFLGNQWSASIEPNDMEGIKWKEYKKYIRLKPPPSISHGVGEIHITKEDTDGNLYPGAYEDFKDFLTTRAGGDAGKRKPYKRSPAPYYD